MAVEADKAEYFDKLYALKESSDEEEGTDDLDDALRPKSDAATHISLSSQPRKRGSRHPCFQNDVPAMSRTNSAPASNSSMMKETPPVRKAPLLRYDVPTPPSAEASFESNAPPANSSHHRPNVERRTVSDPMPGSLVLKNSSGITSMLQKKQKRKRETSITLVPEKDRIFEGLTFFYIPADDIAPLRRARINKAKSFGAIWTKDFGTDITHVIVDKALTYQSIMDYLKFAFKASSLPGNIVLVNEEYPIDCIQFRSLLDPKQTQYAVTGSEAFMAGQASLLAASSTKDKNASPRERGVGNQKSDFRIISSLQQEPSTQEEPRQEVLATATHIPPKAPRETEEIVASPQRASLPKNTKGVLNSSNEFYEMIEIALNTKDLPLDNDDDGSRPPSSNGPEDSDHSDDSKRRSANGAALKKRRKGHEVALNQDNFSCMTGGTGTSSKSNPNVATIESFKELASYYERIKDPWRPMAYRRAITALRKQPKKIVSKDEALLIPHIGESIAEKIEEIVIRGHLRKLDYAKMEPNDIILQSFIKIYGVGLSQAYKWIEQGYKTLDDLKFHAHLTENQRIGIDHYNDFNNRIPRDQMTSLSEIVKRAIADIDPEVEAVIGGSYRRGAATSGDIDFIISRPGTNSTSDLLPFLSTLINHLTQAEFLVAALAVPNFNSSDNSGSKWHGACVLPGNPIWRRIDFLLVPETEMGAALLYLTGDDIFNRSMRLLASKKGMRLNQRGLYKDVIRGRGRVKVTDGSLLEGKDEKRIFKILGVPWRPPEQRILN